MLVSGWGIQLLVEHGETISVERMYNFELIFDDVKNQNKWVCFLVDISHQEYKH